MRQVANGPTLVVNHEPQAMESPTVAADERPAPKLVPVPDAPPPTTAQEKPAPEFETINTFNDLLAVAEKKRDIRFKLLLRNNFSEISFANRRIEYHPVGNAPMDMAQILDDRLRQWTGEQWEIIASEAQGNATLKEIEIETRERHFAQAENNPVVAAVLKTFPKSKILDVRFPGLEEGDGLDLESAQDAALDNPDDFEAGGDDDDENNSPSGDQEDPGAGGLDDYFN